MFAIENQNVEIRVRNKRQLASDPALCQGPARKCISMSQPGSQGALGRDRAWAWLGAHRANLSEEHSKDSPRSRAGARGRGAGNRVRKDPRKAPPSGVAGEAQEEEEGRVSI